LSIAVPRYRRGDRIWPSRTLAACGSNWALVPGPAT